jgi:FkbM family methyltransferase
MGATVTRRTLGALRAAKGLRPLGRFLACEALRPGVSGAYTIRQTRHRVHLRHGSRDVAIFNEIFARGRMSYEPPAEVAAVLDELGALRIGDLGANVGLFGLFALGRWPVSSLCSYEPDPANAELLAATIRANGAPAHWRLEPVAVSNTCTTALFETDLLSESRLALGGGCSGGGVGRTVEVAVTDLFAQPPVDLLKIDIEGAEWAILGDERLASHPARAIVLEWHSRMCPAPKPRHAARGLLEVAGFQVVDHERAGALTNGVMWGLRG